MSLRVLYLIDSLGHGGAEHLLASYLPHMAARGVEPTVVALQNRDGNPIGRRVEAEGVQVTDLEIARLRQPSAYPRVARAVRAARPDLVHTQLQFADILGTIAARRYGVPAVSTLHTLEAPEDGSRESWRRRVAAAVLRRYADRVITVSENARGFAIGRIRLPSKLVVTVHNGIDVTRFVAAPGDRTSVRAELGIPQQADLVATVAVLREPKGIQDAIAAVPHIAARIPGVHYLVVGDGPHRSELERLAASTGMPDRFTFCGNRTDINRMLAAPDLFLLPSHTEALPTVVAEAMASGLPIVATTVGGTPEMVDTDAGILVPPHDPRRLGEAVVDLLNTPARCRSFGERGAAIAAERFDINGQASRLVDTYLEVLDRRLTGAVR
jgi:glycosyltransferase involved in cell wall biosynthesis